MVIVPGSGALVGCSAWAPFAAGAGRAGVGSCGSLGVGFNGAWVLTVFSAPPAALVRRAEPPAGRGRTASATSPLPDPPERLAGRPARRWLVHVLLEIIHRVLDGLDLLRVLVRDLDAKLFLERHDQLDQIERVGVQVFDERGLRGNVLFVHAEL